MITMAYIGNGKATNRYHLPFSQQVAGLKIKTIFARHDNSPWPKQPSIAYTTNIDDIWNDPEVTLVAITTPPAAHYELAMAALAHGKNVLLEKPFTETAAQAKELFAFAKKQGLLLEGYQNRRFDSDFLTVQKVIESGKLGQIYEVENNFDYYRPQSSEQSTGYSRLGSFLYGHAVHTVDQVLSYWGEPESIQYDVHQMLGPGHDADYFDLDLHYPQGLKISVKSSHFRLIYRPSFVVYGTRGRFLKQETDQQEAMMKKFYMPSPDHPDFGVDTPDQYGILSYMDDAGQFHEEKVVSAVGGYQYFYEALVKTLTEGAPQVVTPEQTIKLMEILETGAEQLEATQ